MGHDKYLSPNSFLIWNNAKIYCCNHFKCHIYKYLLNIRTMIEGWKRFWWWCIMMIMWLKQSLLIGQLSLFTVNKNTLLWPIPVYLIDHCAFAFYGDPHMPGMVALVNLLMTLSPSTAECERQCSSINSIKTSLRNSLGQENLCNLMLIAYDVPLLRVFSRAFCW